MQPKLGLSQNHLVTALGVIQANADSAIKTFFCLKAVHQSNKIKMGVNLVSDIRTSYGVGLGFS